MFVYASKYALRIVYSADFDRWEDKTGIHVEDNYTRFKAWAGNIDSHRTGQSSMDYPLRDAAHIRKEVLRLLGQLGQLNDAYAIVKGERVPWDKLLEDEDTTPAEKNDDEGNDGNRSTEMEQIVLNVGDIIVCLLRLSVTIRNPAPHDWFRGIYETDTISYEPFDISHVQNKFPNIYKIISKM
ncbi:hypothetical protein F503_03933 [Ophiostoma piceae UAMH 11346]|uniref:Uncharacterized protein n=1 Tax=Ophiostoma piceae (strain UAMH 11346) TaxID=1262450 RepID=S3C832_OPHP1|nr:hypothetical protein F503_03933 [Ophiostoma piceae UAMH 11346]